MTEQPEDQEVGVDLALHHRFQIELDVGRSAEADVVAEDAKLQSVADEGPEVIVATVEKLLNQTVGAGAECPVGMSCRGRNGRRSGGQGRCSSHD
jgi:hypothetical protein